MTKLTQEEILKELFELHDYANFRSVLDNLLEEAENTKTNA